MITVYTAGPMTNQPNEGRDAFESAAQQLRDANYDVVSPAEMDDEEGLVVGSNDPRTWARALSRDLEVIETVDGVVLLDGWEGSRGACLEAEHGLRHGKFVITLQGAIEAANPKDPESPCTCEEGFCAVGFGYALLDQRWCRASKPVAERVMGWRS